MLTVTHALIDYWQKLPSTPWAGRRRGLEAAIQRVRAGAEKHCALLPYALGDADDEIVTAATGEYLRAPGSDGRARQAAVHDAIEWVRRRLALNRGAVFATLLALEDESVTSRLVPLRLALDATEVETACRNLEPQPGGPVAGFLADWLELLEGSGLHAEREVVLSALEGTRAQAA